MIGLIQNFNSNIPPEQNWWIALLPIMVVAILFFVIIISYNAILKGNRFVARLFMLNKEQHLDLIIRFREKSLQNAREKEMNEASEQH